MNRTTSMPVITTEGLPAVERGAGWMVRYGCPSWCTMRHDGEDGAPGWHQGAAAEVVQPAPFVDEPRLEPGTPLVSARVTVMNDNEAAWGRKTKIWAEFAGGLFLELDAAQARSLHEGLRAFLPQLAQLAVELERESQDDHDGDPVERARVMAELDERIKAASAG
ncbi:DUF6907 domain-containing protein [Streptomyces sp. sk2.1]|uniref:DUF6907 domain-containing protein n=1 Tax=Streptomyces sp. sk2.1 TaxID=2478959 RepID=UPI0011E724E2|nr:hypothetical protein [Streptomyces sp. sk2.1]